MLAAPVLGDATNGASHSKELSRTNSKAGPGRLLFVLG